MQFVPRSVKLVLHSTPIGFEIGTQLVIGVGTVFMSKPRATVLDSVAAVV